MGKCEVGGNEKRNFSNKNKKRNGYMSPRIKKPNNNNNNTIIIMKACDKKLS